MAAWKNTLDISTFSLLPHTLCISTKDTHKDLCLMVSLAPGVGADCQQQQEMSQSSVNTRVGKPETSTPLTLTRTRGVSNR